MRIIKKMANQMKEEIAGAKEYAKLATHYKTDQPTLIMIWQMMSFGTLICCTQKLSN